MRDNWEVMQRCLILSRFFSRHARKAWSLPTAYHDSPCVVCFQVPAAFLCCSCQKRSSDRPLWPARQVMIILNCYNDAESAHSIYSDCYNVPMFIPSCTHLTGWLCKNPNVNVNDSGVLTCCWTLPRLSAVFTSPPVSTLLYGNSVTSGGCLTSSFLSTDAIGTILNAYMYWKNNVLITRNWPGILTATLEYWQPR